MANWKDEIIRRIGENAWRTAGRLSRQYVNAPSQDREAIMAGIEFEKWLAESCAECLEGSGAMLK